jgi:hypothetical protein
MKIFNKPIFAFLLLLLASTAYSDGHDTAEGAATDAERGRQMMREGRIQIVREELHLTEEEAADFWPLYTTYRGDIDAIQDRYADMIAEYVKRYDDADLSDQYATELMDNFFSIKRGLLDVQEKYLPKFRKVLPALKVARLFQLENKINAEIDAQLATVVPLIDPS